MEHLKEHAEALENAAANAHDTREAVEALTAIDAKRDGLVARFVADYNALDREHDEDLAAARYRAKRTHSFIIAARKMLTYISALFRVGKKQRGSVA